MRQRVEKELAAQQQKSARERNIDLAGQQALLKEQEQRKWLINHGKGHLLQFTDEEIKKLKECFEQLDDEGVGSIGIAELEEPLIGLGLADSRDDVDRMVQAVDEDGSGLIEFEEFLSIILGSSSSSSEGSDRSAINKFFKDMSQGKLGAKDLSFGVNVQDLRRQRMMQAITGSGTEKDGGMRILKNVQAQSKYLHLRMKADMMARDAAEASGGR